MHAHALEGGAAAVAPRRPAGHALQVHYYGHTPYAQWLALQEQLVLRRRDGRCADQLVLTQHEPVVTVGRGTQARHQPDRARLAQRGIQVHEVTRGGQATYHGPGVLMGYPVLDLHALGLGLHEYLERLERVLVEALQALGVEAQTRPGMRGAWVQDRKVAAIGVAVRRWISYHGFAVNIDCDLGAFGLITPCGIAGALTTDASSELGRSVSCNELAPLIVESFVRGLGHSVSEPLPVVTG